jgi:superfamily I DNA and/or RNA helicase
VTQDNITALTPYSAQKEEIKKRLQEQKLLTIPVKTITESQGTATLPKHQLYVYLLVLCVGSESGIVLLSTVRSKPKDEISVQDGSNSRKNADIGWIRRNLGFVTDRHQICVGLTRCKYGLVIVGKGV